MNYITSTAANGGRFYYRLFQTGTDADMAAVNVQNRVSTALGVLVRSSTDRSYYHETANSELKTIALYSPDDSYDMQFLNNYMKINVSLASNELQALKDRGGVEFSIRIWLKPDVMAQYKLIPSDITSVLQQQI
ncbi:MAG: efflux RND transporter permease subunit [Butyricimonas paravirosa]